MAVTSIWPVKSRVDRVIDYARNPEKTTEQSYGDLSALHTIDGVVEYAADEMKTETRAFISTIKCREDTAAEQFMETKRLWDKCDGRLCYHGYQSFKADEVDAETAHAIGIKLAEEMWGDRFEVVIATHCNTGHYHNHFVVNSVSIVDGYKFINSPADYKRMREISDRLCREAKLHVIENPRGKGKNYVEWQAEKNGKPTQRGTIRAEIDRAIAASTTEQQFIKALKEMGYTINTRTSKGEPLKYPSLKPPGAKGAFRFHKLGAGYTLEEIKDRIYDNVRRKVPFPEAEREEAKRKRRAHGFVPYEKPRGLRALYIRYCFELNIIVQHPTSVKRVSFLLREDVTKLDRFDAQVRMLNREGIDTLEQLTAYQTGIESKISSLAEQRSQLRNDLKRANRSGDIQGVSAIKAQIAAVSKEIRKLRKEAGLCTDIEQRSAQIENNLEQLMTEQEIERKENERDEHISRSSRSGRAYDA